MVAIFDGEVGQHQLALFGATHLPLRHQSHLLELARVDGVDGVNVVDGWDRLGFPFAAVPGPPVLFDWGFVAIEVYFLQFDFKGQFFIGLMCLQQTSLVLKVVANLLQLRYFESIAADHLAHKTSQSLIRRCLQDLPLAVFSHGGHIPFVLLLGVHSFFLLPCQQTVGNQSKMENQCFSVLLREDVRLLLLTSFRIETIRFSFMGEGILLLTRCLLGQKGLVMDEFQTITVEVDPLRHNHQLSHSSLQLNHTFQQP